MCSYVLIIREHNVTHTKLRRVLVESTAFILHVLCSNTTLQLSCHLSLGEIGPASAAFKECLKKIKEEDHQQDSKITAEAVEGLKKAQVSNISGVNSAFDTWADEVKVFFLELSTR